MMSVHNSVLCVCNDHSNFTLFSRLFPFIRSRHTVSDLDEFLHRMPSLIQLNRTFWKQRCRTTSYIVSFSSLAPWPGFTSVHQSGPNILKQPFTPQLKPCSSLQPCRVFFTRKTMTHTLIFKLSATPLITRNCSIECYKSAKLLIKTL